MALFTVERACEWHRLSVQYVNDASPVCYITSIIFIHFTFSCQRNSHLDVLKWFSSPIYFLWGV